MKRHVGDLDWLRFAWCY